MSKNWELAVELLGQDTANKLRALYEHDSDQFRDDEWEYDESQWVEGLVEDGWLDDEQADLLDSVDFWI